MGAFYRPNEDTMFSVGGTVGTGESQLNAGVSLRLGKRSPESRSRVAMGREIAELKMPDLNANTVEQGMRMVEGTARSMGIEIVD